MTVDINDVTDEALEAALKELGQWTRRPYGYKGAPFAYVAELRDKPRAERQNREAMKRVIATVIASSAPKPTHFTVGPGGIRQNRPLKTSTEQILSILMPDVEPIGPGSEDHKMTVDALRIALEAPELVKMLIETVEHGLDAVERLEHDGMLTWARLSRVMQANMKAIEPDGSLNCRSLIEALGGDPSAPVNLSAAAGYVNAVDALLRAHEHWRGSQAPAPLADPQDAWKPIHSDGGAVAWRETPEHDVHEAQEWPVPEYHPDRLAAAVEAAKEELRPE